MNVVDQIAKLQALEELEKQAGMVSAIKGTFNKAVSLFKGPGKVKANSTTTSAAKESKTAPTNAGKVEEVKAPPSPAPETTKVDTPNSAPPTTNPEAPKVSTAETKSDKMKKWWSNDKNKYGVGMAATGITGLGIGLASGGSSNSGNSSGSSHF